MTRRGNPEKIKPFQFKPGQSGNPGGRPKKDLAAEIAQAVFKNNPEFVYEAMLKALKKGNRGVFDHCAVPHRRNRTHAMAVLKPLSDSRRAG